MPRLSILIPTLVCRRNYLDRLMVALEPQQTQDVEILTLLDDGEQPTGAKRNQLVTAATGDYICHVDDDDLITSDYVSSILTAIEATAPDCISFNARRYTDGVYVGEQIMRLEYHEYYDRPDGLETFVFERPVNHLCPIRADIAKRTPFPTITRLEDLAYATAVRPLLRTETHINAFLYHYFVRSHRHEQRNVIGRIYKKFRAVRGEAEKKNDSARRPPQLSRIFFKHVFQGDTPII
jgi:glycosyltransferase involved in cell wall biosynthesis